MIKIGFRAIRSDSSLFVYHCDGDIAYILLYVDDIVLTGSSSRLLCSIVNQLRTEFAVRDMGALNFFLGIDVQRTADGSTSPNISMPRTSSSMLAWRTANLSPRGSTPRENLLLV
jgi:hypothetical protein